MAKSLLLAATLGATVLCAAACGAPGKVAELIGHGDSRELRKRDKDRPASSPSHPRVLLIAFDGVDRKLLYDLLRKEQMPALAALLGGEKGGQFPHAHLDERFLSTLPSSTMAAWTTAMTGVGPAHHGVTGNEFFIRENKQLGAPAPVTFSDSKPTLAIYTDDYLDGLKKAPSVYDRMRATDPDVAIWVAVHQIYSGADRLLLTKPTILVQAFEQVVEQVAADVAKGKKNDLRSKYAKLDSEVVDVVVNELEKGTVPDVLTVYLSGTDLYAHVAEEGPDEARRAYLREVVDPALARLGARLHQRDALEGRYVVVTSDHGHTQVLHDDAHALTTSKDDDPMVLVRKAGYRLRPLSVDVSDKDDFDAVLTAGGATAYVYLADRSTCPKPKDVCDWTKPPRWDDDVVPIAEAFFTNDADGALAPGMKGALDLVLTRRPKPLGENDLPFEVYVGHGKTVPIDEYLKEHPHPTYVDVAARLRDLAVGPHGERAGDVMLLAHDGDRDKVEERYYFATLYHSWHGSPSRADSEIPLIVANPDKSSEFLRAHVEKILGEQPHQQKLTDVLLWMRGEPR